MPVSGPGLGKAFESVEPEHPLVRMFHDVVDGFPLRDSELQPESLSTGFHQPLDYRAQPPSQGRTVDLQLLGVDGSPNGLLMVIHKTGGRGNRGEQRRGSETPCILTNCERLP